MSVANSDRPMFIGWLVDELLLAVLSHLSPQRGYLLDVEVEEDRQTHNALVVKGLHSLTLTCRKLNAVATPCLYACFIQTWNHLEATQLLVRTLTQKPELSRHIQYIEFLKERPTRREAAMYYTPADLEALAHWLAAAKWLVPDMWSPLLRNRPFRYIQWEYTDSEVEEKRIWDAWNFTRDYNPVIFTTLVVISLADNLSEVATSTNNAIQATIAFKRFPSNCGPRVLRLKGGFGNFIFGTFKATPGPQVSPLQDYFRISTQPFDSENIESSVHMEEIALDIFDISSERFREILKPCSSLKSFSCRWSPVELEKYIRQRPPQQMIDLPALRQALSRLSKSLVSLTIDPLEAALLIGTEMKTEALGSLHDFTSLTELEISGLVLWGNGDTVENKKLRLSSILPPYLRTLRIKVEWTDHFEHALRILLSEFPSLLPHLKFIDCSWRPAPRVIAEYLTAAFAKNGVRLILSISEPIREQLR